MEVRGEGSGEMEAGVIGDSGTEPDTSDIGDMGLELQGVSPSSRRRTCRSRVSMRNMCRALIRENAVKIPSQKTMPIQENALS